MWLRREISPWNAKKSANCGEIHDEEHSEMWNVFWGCRTLSRRRLRFSRKRGIFSRKRGMFFLETWDFFLESWDFFLESYGMVRKRSLKFVWGCTVGERRCVTIMNTAIRSPLNHAIVRAYSQEFYTFSCHICQGFILKWCFPG